MACRISHFMRPEWIIPSLKATSKEGVLLEIAQHLATHGACENATELFTKLLDRELKASTGADHGLAIPHASLTSSPGLVISLARSGTGIDFGALDNQRSHLFFTVINPTHESASASPVSYLQAISAICRIMRSPTLRAQLLEAQDTDAILHLLEQEQPPRTGT